MATDERSRHQLYQRLEETLGAESATTLMEHLPPTGWADVATKADLAALERSTKADLAALEERLEFRFDRIDNRFQEFEYKLMAAFRAEILNAVTSQTRPFLISVISMFVLFAVFITAVKII